MYALIGFALGLAVVGALGLTRAGWIASAVAAGLTFLLIGFATWWVFRTSEYANTGSRWDTRGGGAQDIYVAFVVVGALLLALYSILAIRRVRGPTVTIAVVFGGLLEGFGLILLALAFASD